MSFSGSGTPVGYGAGGAGEQGGGAGGGLRFRNNISVTPGQQITVTVGVGGKFNAYPSQFMHPAGPGAVRVIWGAGRSFPFNAGSTY